MLYGSCIRKNWLLLAIVCGLAVCFSAHGPTARAGEEGTAGAPNDATLQKLAEKEQAKLSRERFLANHHTKVGIEQFNANNFEAAKAELLKALEYDKNHKEAQEYLTRTESLLGLKHGVWSSVVEQEVNRRNIARQIAKVEMENRFEAAKANYNAGNFREAITGFQRVKEIVKYIEPYEDVAQWKASVDDYLKRSETGLTRKLEEEDKARRDEALAIARMRELERKQFVDERLHTLLTQGRQLYEVGRFDEAREKFQAVADLDPENEEAKMLAEAARVAGIEDWAAQNVRRRHEDTQVAWELLEEFTVPQTSRLLYKVLWYDEDKWFSRVLQRVPIQLGEEPEADAGWKEDIRKKLRDPVSFDFIDTPLEDVIHFLRQLTDLTIVLDPQALEGLTTTEITLKVSDMRLEDALNWILKIADLKWTLKDNAVFISNNIQGEAIRRLYDVTDLTFQVRDFRGDLRHLRTRTGTSTGGGDSGGGGQDDIFTAIDTTQEEDETLTGQGLVTFIRQTIAPGTWEDIE